MKKITNYIIEKLKIDKNTKLKKSSYYNAMYSNICDYLCEWLYEKDEYRGRKDNRFEFLKEVDNNIIKLLDYFTGEIEDMSEKLQIPINDMIKFIEENNDKLYDDAKEYYLEMYNKIPF